MFHLTAFVLILLISSVLSKNNVTVNTILGNVIGEEMDGFVLFKGIPYTENAPIGDRRFTESVVRTSPFPNDPYPALNFTPPCTSS